ncbi:TetR/AcrR family transcriptional regulator [Mycolicibacterium sp. S2-37]|uniref:TetR/AcrR family transcriptional regulator n=1 Tax=Mycolicibacterium sp. S2-37 TaxID=2810297 RepID=UPI001A945432|nr:TetR/AcrR family transcriptional regulator [Mycolicibacterium sp. S2-37]MBO0675872.1 TetR/AcrR family transcriptional regulator [Mycolicibacterium sp. S2-37]
MRNADRPTSRDRILDVATDIFYRDGIGAVGVDRIVAEAGVTKPTLYAQFGSKANLVAEVLDRRSRKRQEALSLFLADNQGEPVERLLAVFDWLGEGHGRPEFRGCPFTNAAVELPDPLHVARLVISDYKAWLRSTLSDLAEAAGLKDPQQWGANLQLLIDGANARVVVDDDRSAMKRASGLAATLIACELHVPKG